MKHARLTDALRERASLYAVGALPRDEHDEFESHLRDGCSVCASEVAACNDVAADLALTAPPRAPRPELKDRLFAAIRTAGAEDAVAAAPGYEFTLANEGTWYDFGPGVQRKDLGERNPARAPSYLIRLQPGAVVRTHAHTSVEHCLVVEGDVRVAGRHLHAGDYHRALPGSVHEAIRSDGGGVFLIIEARV